MNDAEFFQYLSRVTAFIKSGVILNFLQVPGCSLFIQKFQLCAKCPAGKGLFSSRFPGAGRCIFYIDHLCRVEFAGRHLVFVH